jgi:hypothetical protein
MGVLQLLKWWEVVRLNLSDLDICFWSEFAQKLGSFDKPAALGWVGLVKDPFRVLV